MSETAVEALNDIIGDGDAQTIVEAIEDLSEVISGGGGATEYVISLSNDGQENLFDLSDANLTGSDLGQDSATKMWVTFNEAVYMYVWLDANDDDDFTLTIPAGTECMCMSYSNSSAIFAFVLPSKAYGWFEMSYMAVDNTLSIISGGTTPSSGAAAQSSSFKDVNNGGVDLWSTISSWATPKDIELHILKLS